MGIKDTIKRHVGGMVHNGVASELDEILRTNMELLWARTWEDTCRDIEWIKNLPGISPGRWAVGYNYIYVMTRVLNELKPHSILDLGLGISSSLISTYLGYEKEKNSGQFEHLVVEQSQDWIETYTKGHVILPSTTIVQRNCKQIEYNGGNTYIYEDFKSVIADKRFDIISIDGPWGGDRNSRRDIVDFLPSILNESFVIIIDDSERVGEQDTIKSIITRLKDKGIETKTSTYKGGVDCSVIVSVDNEYICTM